MECIAILIHLDSQYIVNLSTFVPSDAEMPAHAHYLKVAELECVAFRLQLERGATSIGEILK